MNKYILYTAFLIVGTSYTMERNIIEQEEEASEVNPSVYLLLPETEEKTANNKEIQQVSSKKKKSRRKKAIASDTEQLKAQSWIYMSNTEEKDINENLNRLAKNGTLYNDILYKDDPSEHLRLLSAQNIESETNNAFYIATCPSCQFNIKNITETIIKTALEEHAKLCNTLVGKTISITTPTKKFRFIASCPFFNDEDIEPRCHFTASSIVLSLYDLINKATTLLVQHSWDAHKKTAPQDQILRHITYTGVIEDQQEAI